MDFYNMVEEGKLKPYVIYTNDRPIYINGRNRYNNDVYTIEAIVYATEKDIIIGGDYAEKNCKLIPGKLVKPFPKKVCEIIKKVIAQKQEELTPITFAKWGYFFYSGQHYEIDRIKRAQYRINDNVVTDKNWQITNKTVSDETVKRMIGIEKVEAKIREYQSAKKLSEDEELYQMINEWNGWSDNFSTALGEQKEQFVNNSVNRVFRPMVDRQKELDIMQKELNEEQERIEQEIDRRLKDGKSNYTSNPFKK